MVNTVRDDDKKIAELARKLINLGVRPDNDDFYEEFEDTVNDLLDALEAIEDKE